MIPSDAILLIDCYQKCHDRPLLFRPLSVPCALLCSTTFAARGIFSSCAKLMDGNITHAYKNFQSDTTSSMKCLVLTIYNLGWIILGGAIPKLPQKSLSNEQLVENLNNEWKSETG